MSMHQDWWQLRCEWKWLLLYGRCAWKEPCLLGSAWCDAGVSGKFRRFSVSGVEWLLHVESFQCCFSCDSRVQMRILHGLQKTFFYIRSKLPLLLWQVSFLGFHYSFETEAGLRLVSADGGFWYIPSHGIISMLAEQSW